MSQTAMRAAAVSLLEDCAANAGVKLQVYRARPASVYPPTAFVDSMGDDTADFVAPAIFQHNATINLVCIWGAYDSGEAVDQRDAFVDAFHTWIRTRYHEAGSASLIGPRSLADDDLYVPDWLPPDQQRPYYATRITLEGFETD